MSELKPCPFCSDGGNPIAFIEDDGYNASGNVWRAVVGCDKCGFIVERFIADDDPIDDDWFNGVEPGDEPQPFLDYLVGIWNTRHEPTCTMERHDDGHTKWWECSNCQDTEWYPALFRCPTCGLRVVDGDE